MSEALTEAESRAADLRQRIDRLRRQYEGSESVHYRVVAGGEIAGLMGQLERAEEDVLRHTVAGW